MIRPLRQAIFENQQCRKYERILRKLRQKIFDYYDISEQKGERASELIRRCQDRCAPQWAAQYAIRQDKKLQATPSSFEPGIR